MSVRMPALIVKLKAKVQAENLVEFDSVDFSYNTAPILRNLNIAFPRGKVIAIMGGSGSGKTRLLKLIGGQIKPQKGSVRFDGQAVEDTRGLVRQVGNSPVGKSVRVVVLRGGKTETNT